MVKTVLKQAVPIQLIEVHSGAGIQPTAHGGSRARARKCTLKEDVTPWRPCAGAGLLAGPAALWRGAYGGAACS